MRIHTLLPMLAAALLAGCNNDQPIFFAEIVEPSLCKTIDAYDPMMQPFAASDPGDDLVWQVPIPIGTLLPTFFTGMDADGGVMADFQTEIRLIEFTLAAREGITDFNAIETSTISVEPFPGMDTDGGIVSTTLLTYTKDPAALPGSRLTVAGDQGVNLAEYLRQSAGGSYDGGSTDGNLLVQAVMTGTLPANEWRADLRACVYMRTRFNYARAYGL